MIHLELDQNYLESLLKNETMPDIIKELIAFGVFKYREMLVEIVIGSPNKICYSYNDVYCSYRTDLENFSDVVELANPYVETDFAFLLISDFMSIVESLNSFEETYLGNNLSLDSELRLDFNESKELW